MLQMVNAGSALESHALLMNSVYSDFSVLQEIFLPNTSPAVDPKLVLQTPRAPLPSPYAASLAPGSPLDTKPSPPHTPHVPLSVKELEKEEEVSRLAASPDMVHREVKSPQVDIVNLALEEIRKPPPGTKHKEDSAKERLPWNLAGLAQAGSLPHPYPGYPPPGGHPGTPGYPATHLLPQGLPSDLPYSSYPGIAAAAMGAAAHSSGVAMSAHSAPSTDSLAPPTNTVATNPPGYKMEPSDPSLYYQGPVSSAPGEGDQGHSGIGLFNPHQAHGGLGDPGGLGQSDVIHQTLQQYFGVPGGLDMQPGHDGAESGLWGEHGQLHPGLFPHQEYDYGRGYTDRKKKIIREWNKTNSSPRPAETLTSADPLRPSAYMAGHELFHGSPYSPYAAVKDEPLRSEYPYAAYGYPDLVNPYAHHAMSRREKRKKQDSLPGGNSLTRDERKAMGLPIPCSEIINLPMDEFNDLLSKHELTEEQLTLCRDIRRRGKNKVAAQNCRKRKIDQIKQLETEVTRIKCRKTELVTDHEKLMSQRSTWADLVQRLHDFVLKELGHDPLHWQLQMDHNRQVHILPRENPQAHRPVPQDPQAHEQAVNMAAQAKQVPRGGYDMGHRPPHGAHMPPQPLGHPVQQQIHQNPS